MKLHLGCGQIYLKGYVNIDLPLAKRSSQKNSIADLHQDILKLKYSADSIEEIRLHHVFEHFTRPVACALISAWYLWLKPGGILRIEVPDFYRTAKVIFNPFIKDNKKARATRHLYGSHEAPWAIHCEGYTPKSLSLFLKNYGFKVLKIKKNSWKGTYNFEIFAKKSTCTLDLYNLEVNTIKYLKSFLVDKSEQRIFNIWMKAYRKQLKKMI